MSSVVEATASIERGHGVVGGRERQTTPHHWVSCLLLVASLFLTRPPLAGAQEREREAVAVPAATISGAVRTAVGSQSLNHWTFQLKAFRMDLHPVSNRAFLAFVQASPQWKKSQIASDRHDGDYLKHWEGDDRVPAQELDKPVRYVSYYAAAAYCQAQRKKLPGLQHYRVASDYREGATIRIDYETAYTAPEFHFMEAEWTDIWWGKSPGAPDPGKHLPYMYRSIHNNLRGSSGYSPEQENRHTGGALGFRCAQY